MRRKTPNPCTEESCPVVLLVLHVWSVCDSWHLFPLSALACLFRVASDLGEITLPHCPTTALPLERCCGSKDGPAEVIPVCKFGKLTVRYFMLELQTKSKTGKSLKSQHQAGSNRFCRQEQAALTARNAKDITRRQRRLQKGQKHNGFRPTRESSKAKVQAGKSKQKKAKESRPMTSPSTETQRVKV